MLEPLFLWPIKSFLYLIFFCFGAWVTSILLIVSLYLLSHHHPLEKKGSGSVLMDCFSLNGEDWQNWLPELEVWVAVHYGTLYHLCCVTVFSTCSLSQKKSISHEGWNISVVNSVNHLSIFSWCEKGKHQACVEDSCVVTKIHAVSGWILFLRYVCTHVWDPDMYVIFCLSCHCLD